MSNKTSKKSGVVIEWPTDTHFTVKNMESKYTDMVPITLRFRLKKAVENKEIVLIGKVKPAIGRPCLVFAKNNPSRELLENATKAGVLPIEDKKSSVTVAEVKAAKKTTTPAVEVNTTPVVIDTSNV